MPMTLKWVNIFIVVGVLTVLVLLYYLRRNDNDQNEEEEPSFKEQMLMGVSGEPPKPEPESADGDTKKSFWARVYSGKGPQPKYMRYIAGHEKRRAIEAAKAADEKEKENENI